MTEEERKELLSKYGISLSGYDYQRNMMFALPIALRAKTIVETGLSLGESTIIFLKALSMLNGHLFTYDIEDFPITRELIRTQGLDKYWTFRQVDSIIGGNQWSDGKIDLLYLDSDHSRAHVLAELTAWEKHLQPHAIILIHDTNHPEPHPRSCEGLEAASDWIAKSGWRMVNLNDPLGMVLLWK